MAAAAIALRTEEDAGYTGLVRWIILAAVMLGTLLEVLDTSIVNVAIPEMMGNLGATLDQISWVSTGYIIANVIVLPLTGWLSSFFGRRRYLAGSIILFTAASFLCGTARSLDALVLFRIMQGVGGAALLSTAQAVMLEVFPPAQHGLVTAIFGIGVMVGPTVGPTLGGWITDNYSWPWIFFINLPIGTLAAILTILFMRDSRYQQAPSGRVDLPGIGLLALGIGSLQMVLERGNREDWFQSPLIGWLSALAVVGLLLFLVWELRSSTPAVNLRVLKHRGLAAGTAFAAVLGFGLYGGVFILPIYLQQWRHYTAAQTGWILFPGGIATALTMPVVGKLVTRFSARSLAAVGTLGFITSMLLLHHLTIETGPEHLFWPLVLRGASMGFLWVPLSMAALAGLEGRDLAAGAGLFNLMRQLGGSAGIAFLSTLLDHRTAFHRAVLVERISNYSAAALERLHAMVAAMIASGAPPAIARQQGLALVDRAVQTQATILAFEDVFLIVAIAFLAALPLLLLFKKTRPGAAPAAGLAE
jgi:MFS transporter, DHA2 family, multidrug resistance protein